MSISKQLSHLHPKHYPTRLFKELTILAPVLLLIVLTLNLSAGKNNFDASKDDLQQNSTDSSAALNLANQFLLNNQLPVAEEVIVRSLNQGSETELLAEKLLVVRGIQASPEILKREILAWEKITHDYPLYRDAYFKLAILNLRLGRSFAAHKNIVDALTIDPNNSLGTEMLSTAEVTK